MRRLGIAAGGCAVVAAVALAAQGGSGRPLPLYSPAGATTPVTAIVSDQRGSRLARLDPATFAIVRASARVGWYDGWVRSPDGRLLAVATHSDASNVTVSTLRFATVSTLRFGRRGVRLDGYFRGAIWPSEARLDALAGDCCGPGLTLDTIDTVAKRVVARTPIEGPVLTVARSADGLVLLGGGTNAIAPARLLVIGADGSVRTLQLARILAGSHFDQQSQDPIGSTRQPGLAVDPAGEVAYVVDPDGVIAAVRLGDLTLTSHQLTTSSLLTRLAAWLTPSAQAKGMNGPIANAQWLGDGLLAVAGSDYSATRQRDGSVVFSTTPAGLRIIDTRDWGVRMLDPQADSATVADGVLLATGSSWRSDSSGATTSGEGLAAYGSDGSLRWRLQPDTRITVIAAFSTRALIQKINTGPAAAAPLQLVDLTTGRVLGILSGAAYPWPLLGSGS